MRRSVERDSKRHAFAVTGNELAEAVGRWLLWRLPRSLALSAGLGGWGTAAKLLDALELSKLLASRLLGIGPLCPTELRLRSFVLAGVR